MKSSREQFEEWLSSETNWPLWRTEYPFTSNEDQQYYDIHSNLAWFAWQASREALAQEQVTISPFLKVDNS